MVMTRALLSTMILALAFGGTMANAGQPLPLNPAWAVIFPAEKANDLTHQCSRASPGVAKVTWLPAPDQIVELEAKLAPLLAAKLTERALSGAHWSAGNYYRQYAGLMIDNRLIIYVNGFHAEVVSHQEPSNFWKSSFVGICDGGEFAFGVEYDPQTKTFANFHFNGSV